MEVLRNFAIDEAEGFNFGPAKFLLKVEVLDFFKEAAAEHLRGAARDVRL